MFVQQSTFALYAGERLVLETQDARIRQGDNALGIGAGISGTGAGAVTLKSLRVWDLLPPPR